MHQFEVVTNCRLGCRHIVNILFSGLGKSTLINSLFLTNLYEDREVPEAAVKAGQTVSIEASTVEIEERGVKEPIHF